MQKQWIYEWMKFNEWMNEIKGIVNYEILLYSVELIILSLISHAHRIDPFTDWMELIH